MTDDFRGLMGAWLAGPDETKRRHAAAMLAVDAGTLTLTDPPPPPGPTAEDRALQAYLARHGCGGCGGSTAIPPPS